MVLVRLQIHGSSIGYYWSYFEGPSKPDPSLLSGTWRGIRSDEWRVSTLWILAQSQARYAEVNPLMGIGQNLVLTDAPVLGWETIFKPQNWAFFFLPLKYAFVFRWWLRAVLLVLSAYLFFLETGGKWLPAAPAALSLLFMPVVQWWYSTSYVELTAYFFLLLYTFRRIVLHRSAGQLAFWTLVFAYTSLCFAFLLYVPTLIPALICLVFMMAGILLDAHTGQTSLSFPGESSARIGLSARTRALLLSFVLILAVDAAVLVGFIDNQRAVIDSVVRTSYPGRRREEGGTLKPARIMGGFFNIALLDNKVDPTPIGNNQSEAASFFAFSILILPVLIFIPTGSILRREAPEFFLAFSLLAYILLLAWSFFDLPDLLRSTLQLHLSVPGRVPIVLGILNHILIFSFLSRVRIERSRSYLVFACLYSLAIAGAYLYWTLSLRSGAPHFLSNWNPGLWVSLAILVMMWLLLLQKQLAFWLVFLVFSLASTFPVNPLYRGLGIVTSSRLSDAVRDINRTDQNRSFWIAYDTEVLANYLAANGVRVLNSTQFAPQNELWGKFDPAGQNMQVYNRYAHIVVQSIPELDRSEFVLGPPDAFALHVNPCHPLLEELGVSYYVFPGRVEFDCLHPIRTVKFRNTPIFIYQRSPVP